MTVPQYRQVPREVPVPVQVPVPVPRHIQARRGATVRVRSMRSLDLTSAKLGVQKMLEE